METLLTLTGFGIMTGAMAAVPALGLTLMYGASRFINFAYGEWMTLAAYVTLTAGFFMPLLPAILLGVVVVTVYGPVANWLVFRPLADRHGLVLLVASLGLSFVMQSAIQAGWGVSVQRLEAPLGLGGALIFGPFRSTPLQLVILVVSGVIMVSMAYLLVRTELGMKIRASAENRELARVTGIRVERVSAVTWAIASNLAAIGGVMVAITSAFTPSLGFSQILVVASAIILGGLGNPMGAVLGALVIGVAMEVSTFWLTPAMKPAMAFAALVVVLLVRPSGLFGGSRR